MTQKNKDRVVNALIGILTGGSVVLFGTFLTNKSGDSLAIKKDIENLKLEKVDKQSFEKYKDRHTDQHKSERDEINKKLDLIIKLIEK